MKKEIIIKMPKDAEDIQVYKELSLDSGDSILIKVRENTFGEDATEEQSEPKVFFCYQDRVRKRFNPYDYSCIETTSNHYRVRGQVPDSFGLKDIHSFLLQYIQASCSI